MSASDPQPDHAANLVCDADECPACADLTTLADSLAPPEDGALRPLVATLFDAYQSLDQPPVPPHLALAAFFDLAVSAAYADRFARSGTWTACAGHGTPSPEAYLPYVKTCPRCSGQHDETPTVASNKPTPSVIGDLSERAFIAILAEFLDRTNSQYSVLRSTDRQGDVDAILTGPTTVLAELKASPLTTFPLVAPLADPPTADHAEVPVPDATPVSLFVPHQDARIPLGTPDADEWPYRPLQSSLSDPARLASLLTGWADLYDAYVERRGYYSDDDPRRWLTCGCGGGVDDSKNAPGLDRTDDIKKGTYQMAKFATDYKGRCASGTIRAALLTNVMAVRKRDRYLSQMERLELVTESGERTFLYDAVYGLTDAVFNDDGLEASLNVACLANRS